MLISKPLPFVSVFVEELDTALRAHSASARGLSALQRRLAELLPDGDDGHQQSLLETL